MCCLFCGFLNSGFFITNDASPRAYRYSVITTGSSAGFARSAGWYGLTWVLELTPCAQIALLSFSCASAPVVVPKAIIRPATSFLQEKQSAASICYELEDMLMFSTEIRTSSRVLSQL